MAWFSPYTLQPVYKYEIFGLLLALSVHNGFILPVRFPLALYRALLRDPTSAPPAELSWIADGWPERARYYDDCEEPYNFDFDFTIDIGRPFNKSITFDMTIARDDKWSCRDAITHALKEDELGGSGPPVTHASIEAFRQSYVQWLLDISVRDALRAFVRGFQSLLSFHELHCLQPEALRLLVEGAEKELDVDRLQRWTTYPGPEFDPHSQTLELFWDAARTWDSDYKKKFLKFITGSDRMPMQGEQGIDFKIQRSGAAR